MQQAPVPVRVAPAASRSAYALICALAAFAGAVVATLPVHAFLRGLGAIAIVAWAADRVRVVALRRSPRSVRRIELDGHLQIGVTTGGCAFDHGRVLPDSYVGARITTIVWKPDRARLARAILLLPDMLPPDDFRRLRILLRYGRSESTQGDPASHA
ncbi:MAG: hypothetical protein KGR23_01675 [Betaproteobacteria bacterium]|nr:hypothetical protein [Betaproteobacteria bacterium]